MELLLLTIFLLGVQCVAAFDTIYSGEHFNDVIESSDHPGIIEKAAILVMYQQACLDAAQEIDPQSMPRNNVLVFLMHDYVKCKEYIWYDIPERFDLEKRYMTPSSSCMTAFYFSKGASLSEAPEVWDPARNPDFTRWAWGHLELTIKITNSYSSLVVIEQLAPLRAAPVQRRHPLEAGKDIIITVFSSYRLIVREPRTRKLLHGSVLSNNTEIIITDVTGIEESVVSVSLGDDTEAHEHEYGLWRQAERYLKTLKQPLAVPSYTPKGYVKMMMPKEVYKILRTFYNRHLDSNKSENFDLSDSILNYGAVHSSMIHLTDKIRGQVSDMLQPILEKWCKFPLIFTSFYGIRVYFKGNLLRNHVDFLPTHVISVILQIDQDLGDGEDWLLEVIEFNGSRSHVSLKPGEMLLYESVKLIHGRPRPFQGKYFANAFLHYAPTHWDYKYADNYIVSDMRQIREPLLPLESNMVRNNGLSRWKDEL